MKKIISIFLILIILLIPIVSKAAIEVTEEKLIKAVEKMQQDLNENLEGLKININEETDKIILTDPNGKNYEMTYNLDGKPQFTAEIKLNEEMSIEEMTSEYIKIILPPFGFFMITDMNGTDLVDSLSYFIMKIVKEMKLDEIIDFEKIIEENGTLSQADYEKIIELYTNSKELKIEDELFMFVLKEKEITEKEITLEVVLTINTEKDFSIINGYSEEFLKEFDFANNINGITNIVKPNNNNNQNNNVTANVSKIPQTGNEISLTNVLTTIIIMSGIMIISLSIYNRKRNS